MIDRSSGFFVETQRAPDLRLSDIRSLIFRETGPFNRRIEAAGRSAFFHARVGDFWLQPETADQPPVFIAQGTSVGVEDGRPQIWTSVGEGPVELLFSSIPLRIGILRGLEDGRIVVPPDALPYATVLRHAAEMHMLIVDDPSADDDRSIERRCAEICLIQLIGYARSKVARRPDAPPGLAHDQHLLRAWSAYFADPQQRWTVKALAEAAGLSRTRFSQRFSAAFGAPPLHTLTAVRLTQAEDLLRHSRSPLIEIAFSVGYNSEAAFVRAFHRHYGVPPGRFRTETLAQSPAGRASSSV